MTEEKIVIKFHFSEEAINARLKWKDIKMIRKFKPGADFDIEQLQIVACRFMVNEAGEYMPFQQAFDTFDELSKDESDDVLTKFTLAMQESTVPNVSGSQSVTTSEASSLTPTLTTSPTGLTTSE